MSQHLFKMELHEELEISPSRSVMRVPGGWIYTTIIYADGIAGKNLESVTSVFVPKSTDLKRDLGTSAVL